MSNHCLCLKRADSTLQCTVPFDILNDCLEVCTYDSTVVYPDITIAKDHPNSVDLAALRAQVSSSLSCLDGTVTYQGCAVGDCPTESISGNILTLVFPNAGTHTAKLCFG